MMATPLISGDPAAQEVLRREFRRLHEYNMFYWNLRMTKAQARAEAWRRFRAKFQR